VIFVLLFGSASAASAQQQQQPPAVQAREHIVKKGDTLWDLSRFYFTNPFLWPTIFEANRDVVEDPHWIYPDERLRIPGVESGLPVAVQPEQADPVAGPQPPASVPMSSGPNRPAGRTRFFPNTPPVDPSRENDLELTRQPLFAVPVAEFYAAPWLEDSTAIGVRGRLLGLADPATHGDKLPQILHPYDRVLLGDLRGGELSAGDTMLIVRVGGRLAPYGEVVRPLAILRIDSVGGEVASASVIHQYAEVRAGDPLIPVPAAPIMQRGMPQAIEGGAEGRVIAFAEREPLYGTMDNAFVDIGQEAGLKVGDELIAFVPQRTGDRRQALPEEQVGRLTVVKVMPYSATVRVADASSRALQNGVRVRVVRKMP
jgi:hypothetical protein